MCKWKVSPWFPVSLCLMVHFGGRFLPFLTAAVLHELGHLAALSYFGMIPTQIELLPFGLRIHARFDSAVREAVCILAGPLVSLSLLLFRSVFPALAFWGFIQALVNLLPFPFLDGGRLLELGTQSILPYDRATVLQRMIRVVVTVLIGTFLIIYHRT